MMAIIYPLLTLSSQALGSALHDSFFLICKQSYEVATVIVTVLQMRKLKHTEGNYILHIYSVSKGSNSTSNHVGLIPSPHS